MEVRLFLWIYFRIEVWEEVRAVIFIADMARLPQRFFSNLYLDFPPRTLLDHLRDLAEYRAKSRVGDDGDTTYKLPKSEVTSTLQQFQLGLQKHTEKLQQIHALHTYRSPKRRYGSEETDTTSVLLLSCCSQEKVVSIFFS